LSQVVAYGAETVEEQTQFQIQTNNISKLIVVKSAYSLVEDKQKISTEFYLIFGDFSLVVTNAAIKLEHALKFDLSLCK